MTDFRQLKQKLVNWKICRVLVFMIVLTIYIHYSKYIFITSFLKYYTLSTNWLSKKKVLKKKRRKAEGKSKEINVRLALFLHIRPILVGIKTLVGKKVQSYWSLAALLWGSEIVIWCVTAGITNLFGKKPIDLWLLGVWLGDCCFVCHCISISDK